MKTEDRNIIMTEVEKLIPEMKDVKSGHDEITGKLYFIGTTPENRTARFEVSAKITQISKAPKQAKEE